MINPQLAPGSGSLRVFVVWETKVKLLEKGARVGGEGGSSI